MKKHQNIEKRIFESIKRGVIIILHYWAFHNLIERMKVKREKRQNEKPWKFTEENDWMMESMWQRTRAFFIYNDSEYFEWIKGIAKWMMNNFFFFFFPLIIFVPLFDFFFNRQSDCVWVWEDKRKLLINTMKYEFTLNFLTDGDIYVMWFLRNVRGFHSVCCILYFQFIGISLNLIPWKCCKHIHSWSTISTRYLSHLKIPRISNTFLMCNNTLQPPM